MDFRFRVIFLLMCISSGFIVHSQTVYNDCASALELCPGNTISVNNIGASATVCPNCEDDFNYCFATDNTIWLTFTTFAAGNIQVDFTNLVFETGTGQDNELQATILAATAPCDASTYTQLGNCEANQTGNFALNAAGLTAGTQYYIVIDGDNNGAGITSPAECTFDISISGTAVTRPTPVITISPTDTIICLNDVAQFTATITDCPNNTDYQWFINGNLVSTNPNPVFQSADLQDGDIVSVQTSCYTICSEVVSAASNPITVNSFPIDAGPDQTINPGQSVVLNGSTTASTYSWAPSFYVSNPSNLNPIATPSETTVFTLTATENGCTLSDQATVTVNTFLDIPNTFSPNGDQANDTWVIQGIHLYPNANMSIYDRWGQQVYQSTGYSNSQAWDGTSKGGQKLAEGVYFYVLELRDSEEQVFNGSITILR